MSSCVCVCVCVVVCVCVSACVSSYVLCVQVLSASRSVCNFFAVDNSQGLQVMGGPARVLGRSSGVLGLALGGPGRCLVCTWRGLERPCGSLSVPRGGFGGHGLRACRCDGYCSPLPFCSIAFSTDSEVVIDKCQIPC